MLQIPAAFAGIQVHPSVLSQQRAQHFPIIFFSQPEPPPCSFNLLTLFMLLITPTAFETLLVRPADQSLAFMWDFELS